MIGIIASIASAFVSTHLQAADRIAGPVAADVVEVIDGDTIAVRAHIWPGHIVETRVRLDRVDTPETRRPDCEAEREAGRRMRRVMDTCAPLPTKSAKEQGGV